MARIILRGCLSLILALIQGSLAWALTIPTQPLLQNTLQVNPINLLVMGKSHNLFVAAYNDYTDLDGVGMPDIGYKPKSIDYYGYFDSFKCYTYSSSSGAFVPYSTTSDKTCDGSHWSGDFLNYVTMSRIDVLRKSLYGGKRASASPATLIRSNIPLDAHVWGKSFGSVISTSPTVSLASYIDTTLGVSKYENGAGTTTSTIASMLSAGRNIVMVNMDSGTYPGKPVLRIAAMDPTKNVMTDWVSTESNGKLSQNFTALTLQVRVCVAGLLESNCNQYGSNYLPTGLLHKYGISSNMEFGLLTGSYDSPQLGGVLRDAIGKFGNELNSDGTFKAGGIADIIDRLRINKSGSSYDTSTSGSGNWGNPVATMYYEGLRYLAGKSGPKFITGSTSIDTSTLGLPKITSWTNPYNGRAWCTKPFVTVISEALTSYDSQMPGSPWGFSYSNDLSGMNVSQLGSTLWGYQFGSGSKNVMIGEVSGGTADGLPTSKSASNFDVRGLSPEEPTRQGSFYAAMAAYYARTNILVTPTSPPSGATLAPVRTFAVGLSSPLPKITVPLAGGSVTLVPFGKVVNGASNTMTITNFFLTSAASDGSSYSFQANFDDSEFGSDYDLDSIATYQITKVGSNQVQVTVNSTYAASGYWNHLGFIISGVQPLAGASTENKAGAYLVVRENDTTQNTATQCIGTSSGQTGYNPLNYGLSSGSCRVLPLTFTATFTLDPTKGSTTLFESPLWYMAKYGGFTDNKTNPSNPNSFDPNNVWQWDADGDGNPDNYSLVSNPSKLNAQLDQAFQNISNQNGSGSAGVGSKSTISGDTYYYEASVNSADWSGDLSARKILVSGTSLSLSSPLWNAKLKVNSDTGRQIITSSGGIGGGQAFQWSSLNTVQQQALRASLTELSSVTQSRLNYLRGSPANEGYGSTQFRPRPATKLGDIVNSSPAYLPAPASGSSDPNYNTPSYQSFVGSKGSRSSMVYVGANDGMLHGFQATTGMELLAYIPSPVFGNLNQLASNSYTHNFYVDSTPAAVDAQIGTTWGSYLAGGLGAGGKGLYLLDITSPDSFSESSAASIAKWEFNATNDLDMGYVFGAPQIIKLNDGKWYVVSHNGYNSTNGDAALLILSLNPSVSWILSSNYYKLSTLSGTAVSPNGLSSIEPVDLDGNGTIDVIYAGDLKGNLWKFDLSSNTPSSWKVALNGVPLFSAKDGSGVAQPIVLAPVTATMPVSNGATTASNTNRMVMFGTGKYIESCDKTSSCSPESNSHSVYGIWDWGAPVCDRRLLLQQTLSTNVISGTTYRQATNTSISWKDYTLASATANLSCSTQYSSIGTTSGKLGWYEDLNISGERVVGMLNYYSKTLEYQTYIPSSDSSDICTPKDAAYILRVQYDNGGAGIKPKLADTVAQTTDSSGSYKPIIGKQMGGSLGTTDFVLSGKVFSLSSSTTGSTSITGWNLGRSWKRVTWRELTNN